jgi:hypothetical protein
VVIVIVMQVSIFVVIVLEINLSQRLLNVRLILLLAIFPSLFIQIAYLSL